MNLYKKIPYLAYYFVRIFFKKPWIALQLVWWFVLHRICGKKSNRNFHWKWAILRYPGHVLWWWAIEEIFVNEYYKNLSGCNNILDLGGYFGESAVYLSRINHHVDVYEADPDIYTFMSENIVRCSNVTGYNIAITANEEQKMYFDDVGGYTMWGFLTTQKTSKVVACKHIRDILNIKHYDGIKIDIEWAEYPVVDWINQNYDRSRFEKWYVEFHFFNDEQKGKIQILKDFLWLVRKQGTVKMYNAHLGLEIHDIDGHINILQSQWWVIFISFLKHA